MLMPKPELLYNNYGRFSIVVAVAKQRRCGKAEQVGK